MFQSWGRLSTALQWISVNKTNYAIHWTVSYPLDYIIHHLNNLGQQNKNFLIDNEDFTWKSAWKLNPRKTVTWCSLLQLRTLILASPVDWFRFRTSAVLIKFNSIKCDRSATVHSYAVPVSQFRISTIGFVAQRKMRQTYGVSNMAEEEIERRRTFILPKKLIEKEGGGWNYSSMWCNMFIKGTRLLAKTSEQIPFQ